MEKLKKCPFCGSDAGLTKDNYVMCTNFDCGLNSGLCKAFEIEAWNTRLPSHNSDYAKCAKDISDLYFYDVDSIETEIIAVLKKHFA
jgi:hypothetical protein